MKSLRNPLLLTLLFGGVIGYVAACDNTDTTADINAAPAKKPEQKAIAADEPKQNVVSNEVKPAPANDATDSPSNEPVQVAQIQANKAVSEATAEDGQPKKQPWERQVFFGE